MEFTIGPFSIVAMVPLRIPRIFTQLATADIHREMAPGTLEVYPLGDFGLLETFQHRFCHTENGKEECGIFKNIMVWRKEGAGYKVSRVISYDH